MISSRTLSHASAYGFMGDAVSIAVESTPAHISTGLAVCISLFMLYQAIQVNRAAILPNQ